MCLFVCYSLKWPVCWSVVMMLGGGGPQGQDGWRVRHVLSRLHRIIERWQEGHYFGEKKKKNRTSIVGKHFKAI